MIVFSFHQISSDELEEQICSDLDVPLLPPRTFIDLLKMYLSSITNEAWMSLADDNTDADTIMLLTEMCCKIVEMVSILILIDVAPQVHHYAQISTKDAGSSCNTSVTRNGIEAPQTERNYSTVTAEDVEASVGYSLHICLGMVMKVNVKKRSDSSQQLLQLVAKEVARGVNHGLAVITNLHSASIKQLHRSVRTEIAESETRQMVYHVTQILKKCLVKIFNDKDQGSDTCHEYRVMEVTPYNFEQQQRLVEEEVVHNLYHILAVITQSTTPQSVASETLNSDTQLQTKDTDPVSETHTSVPDGEGFHVGNGSTPLCQKKQESPASSQSGETETLKCKTQHKNRVRFFERKNNKASPVSESDTSTPDKDVFHIGNGSTPLHQRKKKGPAITRMFPRISQAMTSFISFIGCGPQYE